MSNKNGLYSRVTAAQQYLNDELRKKTEKKESIVLKELGKYSAFREVFEGISLEEQDFSYIGIQGDIITKPSFIEGRNFGFTLISKGFTEENYATYVKATENKKTR